MTTQFAKLGSLIIGILALSANAQELKFGPSRYASHALSAASDQGVIVVPSSRSSRSADAAWTFPDLATPGAAQVLAQYAYVDPNHIVPTDLLQSALLFEGFNLSLIPNNNYLTVIDFTVASAVARFYLINLQSGEVHTYHVAHGIGSDPSHSGYATTFSNTPGSDQTSLGFYLTGTPFAWSGHGTGVNLTGLSSTDSNAASRGIYFHGADYVYDEDVLQGRSEGCFAMSLATDALLFPLIDNGSIIYSGLSNGIH